MASLKLRLIDFIFLASLRARRGPSNQNPKSGEIRGVQQLNITLILALTSLSLDIVYIAYHNNIIMTIDAKKCNVIGKANILFIINYYDSSDPCRVTRIFLLLLSSTHA